jgi:hypothetical protein
VVLEHEENPDKKAGILLREYFRLKELDNRSPS